MLTQLDSALLGRNRQFLCVQRGYLQMSDGMELFAHGSSLELEPRLAGEEWGVPGYRSNWTAYAVRGQA
jgi:hypothetical protein